MYFENNSITDRFIQQLPPNAGAEKNRLRLKSKNIFEKTGLLAHLPSSFLKSVHAQEPGSSSSLLNQEVFITSTPFQQNVYMF